jgi:ribosomal-protein-alanine N-acetyltransferase
VLRYWDAPPWCERGRAKRFITACRQMTQEGTGARLAVDRACDATEAARGLLRWAFGTLDLNRVQAETDTRNVASARVLEKLGFVRAGTLREDCVVNGEVSDSWVYGLIRREWRPSSLTGMIAEGDHARLEPAAPARLGRPGSRAGRRGCQSMSVVE